MQPLPLAKIFGGEIRNWLDLSKFDWIWTKIGKLRRNLCKGNKIWTDVIRYLIWAGACFPKNIQSPTAMKLMLNI